MRPYRCHDRLIRDIEIMRPYRCHDRLIRDIEIMRPYRCHDHVVYYFAIIRFDGRHTIVIRHKGIRSDFMVYIRLDFENGVDVVGHDDPFVNMDVWTQ